METNDFLLKAREQMQSSLAPLVSTEATPIATESAEVSTEATPPATEATPPATESAEVSTEATPPATESAEVSTEATLPVTEAETAPLVTDEERQKITELLDRLKDPTQAMEYFTSKVSEVDNLSVEDVLKAKFKASQYGSNDKNYDVWIKANYPGIDLINDINFDLGEQEYNKLLLDVEAHKDTVRVQKLNEAKGELEILNKVAEAIKPQEQISAVDMEAMNQVVMQRAQEDFNNYIPEPIKIEVEGFVSVDVKSEDFMGKLNAEITRLSEENAMSYYEDKNGIPHYDIKSVKDRIYYQETINALQAQISTLKKGQTQEAIQQVAQIAQKPTTSATPDSGGNVNTIAEFFANKAKAYSNM